jgi:hypothetical protein
MPRAINLVLEPVRGGAVQLRVDGLWLHRDGSWLLYPEERGDPTETELDLDNSGLDLED